MPFEENEFVYLVDQDGKKHWLKVSFGMLKIASLGTIDGSRFKDLDDGSVTSIAGKQFTIFRPGTVELIESLDRGAQIITPKDAASILFNCDVRSGNTILEVGAGSGALTTALTAAVAPTGKVHTVEFKEENALRALKNLKRTGLDSYWTYQIGDARDAKVEISGADALIMDMPDPENALDNLLPCLRSGGRICAYIPNTNQLELIVNALRERNFSGVFSIEIMQREMEVHRGGVRPSFSMLGHTGYLVYGRKTAQN
jgi:tRNA (adenine57-N1/adenine58-N1)-methyltransferase